MKRRRKKDSPKSNPILAFTGSSIVQPLSIFDKFQRDKLSSRSNLSIYLRLNDESKAYRIYIPSVKKVQITRDVIFDENRFLTIPLANSTFLLASLFSLTRHLEYVSSDDDSDTDTPTLEVLTWPLINLTFFERISNDHATTVLLPVCQFHHHPHNQYFPRIPFLEHPQPSPCIRALQRGDMGSRGYVGCYRGIW